MNFSAALSVPILIIEEEEKCLTAAAAVSIMSKEAVPALQGIIGKEENPFSSQL